jgi:uncharacterized membrane protein YedE/YeeE
MRRVLLAGPTLLTLGGLVIAVSFLTSVSREVRIDTSAAGFALIGGGALVTMFGMGRILREDSYVALRTDGLLVRGAGRETLVVWDALTAARWDPGRSALVLEREPTVGPPIVLGQGFARATGAEVADRIEQTRRRAAMNMLH